jgi:NAD(P)H-dependent flavin oxidoreductase YrpB (nitropropane dioxygenase family)
MHLAGSVVGAITDIKPAVDIINEMVSYAIQTVRRLNTIIAKL